MIEIVAFDLEEAKMIESYGADRVKLVSGIGECGLTPSYGLIEQTIKSVNIPVNVVISPKFNSFVYSDFDMNVLLKDIKIIKDLGVSHITFGSLNENMSINTIQLERVIDSSENINIVFNSALKYSDNLLDDLKILSQYDNISNILIPSQFKYSNENSESIENIIDLIGSNRVLLDYNYDLCRIDEFKSKNNINNFSFSNVIRTNKSIFNPIDEYKLNKLFQKLKTL